jgi:hypothetical protein
MKTNNREIGFYWVKSHGEWTVAEYDSDGYWNLAGSDVTLTDDKLEEINENKIENNGKR